MRIIKLSPDDIEMKTREMVDSFFLTRLHEKDPKGQFLLTKGRIAEDGIQPGEYLVFTYLGDLVYVARSASRREETEGPNARQYPHYFCVDVDSIKAASGRLAAFEDALRSRGLLDRNLVKSQGWPIVPETDQSRDAIWQIVTQFITED
jgi:hypothetical protein